MSEFLLLETAASFGLSEALQDAVAGAIGDGSSGSGFSVNATFKLITVLACRA